MAQCEVSLYVSGWSLSLSLSLDYDHVTKPEQYQSLRSHSKHTSGHFHVTSCACVQNDILFFSALIPVILILCTSNECGF